MKVNVYSDFVRYRQPKDLSNYYYYEQGLSDDDIAWVKDYAASYARIDGTAGGKVNPEYRSSQISWLHLNSDTQWLYKKIGAMAQRANEVMWNFSLVGMAESFQFGEYDADQKGHYDWHVDVGTGDLSRRKISIVVQLTDPEEYEGGELDLLVARQPYRIPKGKGNVCLFPSYILHRVSPVTKGKRHSLVLWVSGEPFR